MKQYLNKVKQLQNNARLLQALVAALLLIVLVLIVAWSHSTRVITVHIPPRIPASGLTLSSNSVPRSTVYAFTYYVWQNLNDWPTNGKRNYLRNMKQFAPMLTPAFRNRLLDSYQWSIKQGQLQKRIRVMQGISGSEFKPALVKALGNDTWLVRLRMRLTERLNGSEKAGMSGVEKTSIPVKDVAIEYTFRVVGYNVGATRNPWGLAIAGFAAKPVRLKTYM